MAGKSIEERLQELEKRKKQIIAQEQALKSRLKEIERKERTRRLIQIGALMDKAGMKTKEQADAFYEALQNDENIKKWFDDLMASHSSSEDDIIKE